MVKDAYSIPRIQDTLDCLQGTVWFTLLDLKSGYWQVELEEASKALMAFTVGPLRFYMSANEMPFGLTNALAMFQHLMETCLGNLQFQWCIIYLDDIIMFCSHPKRALRKAPHHTFAWLWVAGLKLQPAKCEFFKPSVVYLGHEISKEGIQTDGHKVEAIKNWPIPVMVMELRSFLGFIKLLSALHKGVCQGHLTLSMTRSLGTMQPIRKSKFSGQKNAKMPFNRLKVMCTSAPVLAFMLILWNHSSYTWMPVP